MEDFFHILNFVAPYATQSISLHFEDELLLTLSRLRLGLKVEDLAVRFAISRTSVSRIFEKWIDLLYIRLRFLVAWPSREVCKQNMPRIFTELYPDCRCIILKSL